MPGVKFVISDPKTRKSFQLEVETLKTASLIGKKIGEEFNGDLIGLNGYSLKITGGSDKDGFPMHPQVGGPGRKKVLLSSPPGFHPKIKGERRRKLVRGNTISEDISQINVKVEKSGEKPLEQIFPAKEKKGQPKAEEKSKVEEKKEEAKERKPEEKKEEKKEKTEEKPKEKEAAGGEGPSA